jgi:hypothetical protein
MSISPKNSPQHTATEFTEEIQDWKLPEEPVVEAVPGAFLEEDLEPLTQFLSPYLPNSLKERFNQLEKRLNSHPVLHYIALKTKIPPLAILLVALFSWIQVFKKQPLLASFCTHLYPIWWSIKGVERPRVNDDERLLTYWAINGIFQFPDYLISLRSSRKRQTKTRGYFVLRILLNLWLQRDGSLFTYRKVIRPLLPLD